jgi:hypothetical protein
MAAKGLSERVVSVPTSVFVPWTQQMSAHHLKTGHTDHHFSCVIHNVSSGRGD